MQRIPIRDLYSYKRSPSSIGIQGYFVQNKYVDAAKIKQQRMYESRDKSKTPKPMNVAQKKTFIDQVKKQSAKLPAPTSYDPKQYQSKSKTQSMIRPGNRKTIFDDIAFYQKKQNFPAASTYSKVVTQMDKAKLKSNLSKAQNSNYLDSSMRKSLQNPGVGNYNSGRFIYDFKKSGKWILPKTKSKSQSKVKLPPVGTYNPRPASFSLFQSISNLQKSRSKSNFGKSSRFKVDKPKTIPYYNILSEWGMKDKRNKKDILAKISRASSSSRSVYY